MRIILQTQDSITIEKYRSNTVPQKGDIIQLNGVRYEVQERTCVLSPDSNDDSTSFQETWALKTLKTF